MGKTLLLYRDKNEESTHNTLDNFDDKKEINHLCLMTNEQASDPNSNDNDDDGT